LATQTTSRHRQAAIDARAPEGATLIKHAEHSVDRRVGRGAASLDLIEPRSTMRSTPTSGRVVAAGPERERHAGGRRSRRNPKLAAV
jgi:hypothetical protein